jgi:predicted dehydrogenase
MAGAELVGVYDVRHEVAAAAAAAHGAAVFPSCEALAAEVDAMVVAVPTVAHAEVGCPLLERGIHLLVEKPMASTLEEADRLLAAAGDRLLAVGHVEFYNPAVQALLKVGAPVRYASVERLARFTPRSLDVDVVLDLMIHDLQIVHALDESPVREIRATGVEVLSPRVDIANARVELESGCVVNLTASRVSAEKVRQLRVFFTDHYYSLDYQEQTIKGYRLGDEAEGGDSPGIFGGRRIVQDDLEVVPDEPLRRELECFVGCCTGEPMPLVDGRSGRRALATALEVVAMVSRSAAPAPERRM